MQSFELLDRTSIPVDGAVSFPTIDHSDDRLNFLSSLSGAISLSSPTTSTRPEGSRLSDQPPISSDVVDEEAFFFIDDTLAELHVRLFLPLRILTCLECYGGILPGALISHMRQKHQYPCPFSKEEVFKIAEDYRLPLRIEDVNLPDVMDPIPDLASFNGYYCLSPGCPYAVVWIKNMISHVKSHPGKGKGDPYAPCVVQRPFTSINTYRRVFSHAATTNSTGTVHVEEDLTILSGVFQKAVSDDAVLRVSDDPGDTPPWLNRLYWPNLVHSLNPKQLADLVSLPKDGEKRLEGVRKALNGYFRLMEPIVRSDRFTTSLKHLHTDHVLSDKSVVFLTFFTITDVFDALTELWTINLCAGQGDWKTTTLSRF